MNHRTQIVLTLIALLAPVAAHGQEFRLPAEPKSAQPRVQQAAASNGDPIIKNCRVDLVEDVDLAALDAGLLLHLGVREGDQVQSEQVIARVDDREPKQQRRQAAFAYNSAVKRSQNNISVRFAEAQEEVARANLATLQAANKGGIKAITEQEMREAELEVRSGALRVENAQHELELAGLDAWTAKVEVETAEMMIERRVIRAPFDGEVQKVYRQQQEWVSPGDPILRLLRLDTLYVEGFINVDKYSFSDLKRCEVTVEVPVAGDRPVQATGRVVWVDPILMRSIDGQIAKIRAEITNRQEKGEWLIHPKRQATMTVHMGTGGVSAAARQ